MPSHQVAAVVLNWNRRDDTLACLESLQKQQHVVVEVIVVDNGSVDDSVEAVRNQFTNATVIETGANLGYADGNNIGMLHALDQGLEYILVLNNDTVLEPECVHRLLADLKLHSDVAAAAPKSFYFENPETVYFAGGQISPDGLTLHTGGVNADGAEHNLPYDTEWLTGCAILFRSTALREIGLFESRYYLLYEDADWSLRARKAGYRLRIVPDAKLWHKLSLSFGNTWSPLYLYYYTRNNLFWIERNFSIQQKPRLYYVAFRRSLGNLLLRNRKLSPKEKGLIRRAVLLGVSDYLSRRFGKQYYF